MKTKLKKILTHRHTKTAAKVALTGGLVAVSTAAFADIDPTKDLLAGMKTNIDTNFGQGSTLEHLLYLAEIIGGAVTYMKTKNLLGLVSIPILVLVTWGGFKLFS